MIEAETLPIAALDQPFSNRAEWDEWSAANRLDIFSPERCDAVANACLKRGVKSHFLGDIPARSVEARGPNYREQLLALGFNPRQRAVLDIIHAELGAARRMKIHLHEAVTPFALLIKGRFPYVLASEYFPEAATRAANFPVPHIDICASGLPDGAFDLIVSQEVLEHVPSLDAALADMARILRPGGRLIATVPFLQNREQGVRKASLKPNGEIDYHTEPEYHGNPVDPSGGALVFEIPAWDILDRLRSAGFSRASMRFIGSSERGILSAGMTGLFVLDATR